jgi:hypothetical protein
MFVKKFNREVRKEIAKGEEEIKSITLRNVASFATLR